MASPTTLQHHPDKHLPQLQTTQIGPPKRIPQIHLTPPSHAPKLDSYRLLHPSFHTANYFNEGPHYFCPQALRFRSTQSVLGEPNPLWVVIVKYPKCATSIRHTLSGSRSTLWALITTTQSGLGSRSTLCVVVMSGQCVLGWLTHFGWRNTCQT